MPQGRPPLIDVLQNLWRRKTLGTYYYFMHPELLKTKQMHPPSQKYTKHPKYIYIYIYTNRKPRGKNQHKTKKIKFARGEEKKGEKGRRTYSANADDLVDKKTTTKKRTMVLSVFYWPCLLPRQGYCVQIHYRVYSSLRDFWPLGIVGLFLYKDFWKMIFWLVWKLEIKL